jgi:hypothetical protein
VEPLELGEALLEVLAISGLEWGLFGFGENVFFQPLNCLSDVARELFHK